MTKNKKKIKSWKLLDSYIIKTHFQLKENIVYNVPTKKDAVLINIRAIIIIYTKTI